MPPSPGSAVSGIKMALPRTNGPDMLYPQTRETHPSHFHEMPHPSYQRQRRINPRQHHISHRWLRRPIPQRQAFAFEPSKVEAKTGINTLELAAIEATFTLWAPEWAHGTVVVHTDNTTAEHGINNESTKAMSSMDALRQILLHAAGSDISLHIRRMSTHDNQLADALSRLDWHQVANLCPQWTMPFTMYRPKILLNASPK